MITFVTFKWNTPGYRSTFTAEHVNTLRRMVARNYPDPHQFVCVTDAPYGLDSSIRRVPLWNTHANLVNPHGPRFPSCYRRLRIFSAEAKELIGERICMLDIDTVVTGNLRTILNCDDDFVAWGGTTPGGGYNCSMVLHTAGTRTKLWTEFDPTKTMESFHAGFVGSDQGWITQCLGKGTERILTQQDGVYCYRLDIKPNNGRLPLNAKLVFWNGKVDPWHPEAQRLEWVRRNYR